MIKVGVTGGIGSGKTTFCKKWEELGAYVLYADDFAKELMISDEELISSIKTAFGKEAYYKDGSLNRAFLAEEAFEKGRVKELNAIVHPLLWKRIDALSEQKEKAGIEVFVKEAAILLQNGRPEHVDYVILLFADEEERIDRAVKRDGSDSKKIKDRIQNQPNFNSKINLADYIVRNNGSIKELEIKAEEIFKLIK
ncbi:MAG: dephospho-CoA kinase [Balneolaceae bacterium]